MKSRFPLTRATLPTADPRLFLTPAFVLLQTTPTAGDKLTPSKTDNSLNSRGQSHTWTQLEPSGLDRFWLASENPLPRGGRARPHLKHSLQKDTENQTRKTSGTRARLGGKREMGFNSPAGKRSGNLIVFEVNGGPKDMRSQPQELQGWPYLV